MGEIQNKICQMMNVGLGVVSYTIQHDIIKLNCFPDSIFNYCN